MGSRKATLDPGSLFGEQAGLAATLFEAHILNHVFG